MPDGTVTGVLSRPVAVYPATGARCPRCDRPVEAAVQDGAALVVCRHVRDREARCPQYFAIVGIRGRLCIVAALSAEEYRTLRETDLDAEALLTRLRILGVPLMPAA